MLDVQFFKTTNLLYLIIKLIVWLKLYLLNKVDRYFTQVFFNCILNLLSLITTHLATN